MRQRLQLQVIIKSSESRAKPFGKTDSLFLLLTVSRIAGRGVKEFQSALQILCATSHSLTNHTPFEERIRYSPSSPGTTALASDELLEGIRTTILCSTANERPGVKSISEPHSLCTEASTIIRNGTPNLVSELTSLSVGAISRNLLPIILLYMVVCTRVIMKPCIRLFSTMYGMRTKN